jgi:hypothetical protein
MKGQFKPGERVWAAVAYGSHTVGKQVTCLGSSCRARGQAGRGGESPTAGQPARGRGSLAGESGRPSCPQAGSGEKAGEGRPGRGDFIE